jgi:hypothetical protein
VPYTERSSEPNRYDNKDLFKAISFSLVVKEDRECLLNNEGCISFCYYYYNSNGTCDSSSSSDSCSSNYNSDSGN